jgi:hypothetical protein
LELRLLPAGGGPVSAAGSGQSTGVYQSGYGARYL